VATVNRHVGGFLTDFAAARDGTWLRALPASPEALPWLPPAVAARIAGAQWMPHE
jgi:hypothetical protein